MSDTRTEPKADPSNEPVSPPDVKPGPLPGTPPDVNPIPPGTSPREEHETGASEPMPGETGSSPRE
jgi:hypothetical protein